MTPLRRLAPVLVALAALVLCFPISSQAADARVSGVVKDSSGGGIPGATVVIANQATHATQTVVTGADGSYSATVPAGVYTLTVSLKGFGRQVK